MSIVVVSASFDDFRSAHARLLEEAARLGPLHVLLWSDAAVAAATGAPPKFPYAEREYVVRANRHVAAVHPVDAPLRPGDPLPAGLGSARVWAVAEPDAAAHPRGGAPGTTDIACRIVPQAALRAFPPTRPEEPIAPATRARVIVTGCYDWFHSGHVRFFEECSELGDLYVAVGHDENIRLLKGDGHPLIAQDERRYVVASVRYVHQALVTSGMGWLDAEPEIARIRPDIYAVNEDGDKPEKRAFCARAGIRYVVLKRTPRTGLPRRQSTALRGF